MRPPTGSQRRANAALAGALLLAMCGTAWADPPPAGSGPPTSAPATANEDRDVRLERQIETAFEKDKTLTAQGLDVQVAEGKATLTGTTPTQADRQRAGQLAKVEGISEVDNQIVVRVTEPPAPAKPVNKPPADKKPKK